MKSVQQLIPAATPNDAITNQAFAWRDILQTWGYDSEIVAEHVHPDLMGTVHRLDRAGRRLVKSGPLILRYALWSATVDAALSSRSPLALVYHNITPGKFLRDFSPSLADLCDRGREAISVFRGKTSALIADSSFNAEDLRTAGLDGANVVPLLLEFPDDVPRRSPNREPIVVTVGRIVPNKRLDDVLRAFTLFQQHRAPSASLVVVGSDTGFEQYKSALQVLAARLGTERLFFTGPISSEARDAWYRRADVYLSMSQHEGFCAPLIEAIAHGAPVVARNAGAQPETLGSAGIVLDGDDLPLVAEALHELSTSPRTRRLLADAAEQRLAELRPEAVAPRIRASLDPILAA